MIYYLIELTEFQPSSFTLRTTPPQDDTPEKAIGELDIATISGDENEVKAILGGMHGASPFA